MVVDINTDFLINNKITADQYLILALVLTKKPNILKEYCLVNSINTDKITEDIKRLSDAGLIEGYVSGVYDFEHLKSSTYASKMFSSGDYWIEFYNEYPTKVTRTDGTADYLRTDQARAQLLYLSQVKGRKSVHDHLLKCLRHEIKFREANGSMKFMKRMTSWLSSKEWEAYQDQIDDLGNIQTNVNETGYGTELL